MEFPGRLFKDAKGWTMMDFKTDHDLLPNRPVYEEAQLRLYVEAIDQATGEPTRASCSGYQLYDELIAADAGTSPQASDS